MQSKTVIQIKRKYIQLMIKKCLSDVSISSLEELTKKLNSQVGPNIEDVFFNFLNAMLAFSKTQRRLGEIFQSIFSSILQKASHIKEKKLFERVEILLSTSFTVQFQSLYQEMIKVESKIVRECKKVQENQSNASFTNNSYQQQQNIQSNNILLQRQNFTNSQMNNFLEYCQNLTHTNEQPTKSESTNSQSKDTSINIKQQLTLSLNEQSKDCEDIKNLIDKNKCICEKSVIESKSAFGCPNCQSFFHWFCIGYPKPNQLPICPVCILENISPINPVHQTIFVGHLNETKLTHKIKFTIKNEQYLRNPQLFKIQLRSLKLSQTSLNQIQFPDSASLSLNENHIFEYFALNKNSSIKYRKDLPLELRNINIGKENILKISQKDHVQLEIQRKRFCPTRHLIGICIVKKQTIEESINRIKKENILPFTQGKQWVSQLFKGKPVEDDGVNMVQLRMSLKCPLTKETIETPVRGIYCSHIHCFDLRSYLTLMLSTKVPSWTCPICKTLAAELKFDEMISIIIKKSQNKKNTQKNEVQVVFTKNDKIFFVFKPQEQKYYTEQKGVKLQDKSSSQKQIIDIEKTRKLQKRQPIVYCLDANDEEAKIQSPKLNSVKHEQ